MAEQHYRHGHAHGPVQTSAVYLIGWVQFPAEPPPSPAEGVPGTGDLLCSAIEELSLDGTTSTTAGAAVAALPSPLPLHRPLPSPPPISGGRGCAVAVPDLASPTATAPPSPSSRPVSGPARGPTPSDFLLQRPPGPPTYEVEAEDPPIAASPTLSADRLAGAIHVLQTEAAALSALARIYSTDKAARAAFDRAVDIIVRGAAATQPPCTTCPREKKPLAPPPPREAPVPCICTSRPTGGGGALVITGVGKSGHIARKLVATFNSLSVRSSFLHPTEALHGDLGVLAQPRRGDSVLLVSFSGRTPELLALVPHLHLCLPVMVLTAAPEDGCEIAALRRRVRRAPWERPGSPPRPPMGFGGRGVFQDGRDEDGGTGGRDEGGGQVIVLPAPIPVSEVECFGVAAPTSSTTVALALGDALAVVAARELHGGSAARLAAAFGRNHPGGAIGAAAAAAAAAAPVASSVG